MDKDKATKILDQVEQYPINNSELAAVSREMNEEETADFFESMPETVFNDRTDVEAALEEREHPEDLAA